VLGGGAAEQLQQRGGGGVRISDSEPTPITRLLVRGVRRPTLKLSGCRGARIAVDGGNARIIVGVLVTPADVQDNQRCSTSFNVLRHSGDCRKNETACHHFNS